MTWRARLTGWAWPVDARKVHYYVDGKPVCSKAHPVYVGDDYALDLSKDEDRYLACVTCLRKAVARGLV